MTQLEKHFEPFRKQIIGIDQTFEGPFGVTKILYADWIASGRMYAPIEKIINDQIAPFIGNTHTESTVTGSSMTQAYHQAKHIIKEHVKAHESDVLISSNSGMTGVVNKFQRILGLKIHENFADQVNILEDDKPIVFVSHMEHHSNQTSWLETIADVEVIKANKEGLVCMEHLESLLHFYSNRKTKIAAITSCSNVTGISTPYHDIAEMMHDHNGLCFVDFACSAPYIDIEMRPENNKRDLDAIYFSPHKFLGGPSSSGILIFDPNLYKNTIPDNPGGGTVDWTNPWGEHKYIEQIETREDGGTPSFLQTLRVALCIKLKEEMGVENMERRENELLAIFWERMPKMKGMVILAEEHQDRLGAISFYIKGLHYNLGVKMLNDRFGIQMRGGCSCAGTYGHYLLQMSQDGSNRITDQISLGDLTAKPGWIRLSVHPTMTNEEAHFICAALEHLCEHHETWANDYEYLCNCNEFQHKSYSKSDYNFVSSWFSQPLK